MPVRPIQKFHVPPAATSPTKGREGHGAAFAWLWGEFNQVRRSEPGAVW